MATPNISIRDTIVAIATPPGKGGVGIIRISGAKALEIGQAVCSKSLQNRRVTFSHFKNEQGEIVDSGLAVYFQTPHSFTGEDVVELQGHGGPVIQDMLLEAVVQRGARLARAGEFSERAFLNDKIDLTQAEAIADLIDSGTRAAARGALRTLKGAFSSRINEISKELIELRVFVEAAIDFPEEEIDFLADAELKNRIDKVQSLFESTINEAGQGAVLRNGFDLVLAGKPNAGKSSLLNTLVGEQAAIVTHIPGTTRDIIKQTMSLDGLPLHLTDTAGLRETDDEVEQIGVERAKQAIQGADHVLRLIDSSELESESTYDSGVGEKETLVLTKIDLLKDQHSLKQRFSDAQFISVKTEEGLHELRQYIKTLAGYSNNNEGNFSARRRHVLALEKAYESVKLGVQQLRIQNAGELLADELRQAHQYLGEITGEYSADDLLGEIFSGFCIGK